MSLLVLGGSGFVGKAVSKYAISQGLKVHSLSRRGVPGTTLEPWQSKVQYIKGNALDLASYQHLIPEVSAVVHSIGVLIDSRTPLNIYNTYEGSYEQMNRDTALKALEAMKGLKTRFVYVSAERGMFFSPRYLRTKREVEEYLARNANEINYAVVRPGFMPDDSTSLKTLAGLIKLTRIANPIYEFLRPKHLLPEGFVPAKPLHVDLVAKAIVLSAMLPEFEGKVLDTHDIEAAAALKDLTNRSS